MHDVFLHRIPAPYLIMSSHSGSYEGARDKLEKDACKHIEGVPSSDLSWFLSSSSLPPIEPDTVKLHRADTISSPSGIHPGNGFAPLRRSKTTDESHLEGSDKQSEVKPRPRASSVSSPIKRDGEDHKKSKIGGFFRNLIKRSKEEEKSVPTTREHHENVDSDVHTAIHSNCFYDGMADVDPLVKQISEQNKARQVADQSRERLRSESNLKKESTPKYDAAGDVIPPHPERPALPSAFSRHPKYTAPSSEGGFHSFLKHHVDSPSPVPRWEEKPPIEGLQGARPLRRVGFATTVFQNDPPQQIPSRNPRKGNVEIDKDGGIIIHQITKDELKKASSGIVVGGSLSHSDEHTKEVEEAEQAAKDRASSSSGDKTSSHAFSNKPGVTIDKPMIRRHAHETERPIPQVTLKLDELYARCCHLREILPIPATLKQIPKGTTDPLMILQLRNPRPSMIEVVSFADFVRIAPIVCVVLDGVHLSREMFRIIMASMVAKKQMEKLSLRNVPIDEEGWKTLAWFVAENKAFMRLDLTQCPSLELNLKTKKSEKTEEGRMTCRTSDRLDRDWRLIIEAIKVRGGIDEIVLSGCRFQDMQIFQELISVLDNTYKLGLAYNNLTESHFEILVGFLKHHKALGLDIGYNDLSRSLNPLVEYFEQEGERSKMMLLSLNATNLGEFPDAHRLLQLLSRLPQLKFLDLSRNAGFFQDVKSEIVPLLPLFPAISRIHMDECELSNKTIIGISEVIPWCKSLCYVSLLGNSLNDAAVIALVASVRASNTLFSLDLDYENVLPKYKEQIGLYTMKNMEKVVGGEKNEKAITERMVQLLHSEKVDKDSPGFRSFICELTRIKSSIDETIKKLFALQLEGQLNLEGKETLVKFCFIDSSLEKGMELINSKFQHQPSKFSSYTRSNLSSAGNRKIDTDVLPEDATEIKEGDSPAFGMSRTNSSTSNLDKSQGRQEANFFKLSNLLGQSDGETSPKETKNFSEDDIKGALLNTSDFRSVVKLLNDIKREGIPLESIYSKSKELFGGGPSIDTLNCALKKIEAEEGDDHPSSPSKPSNPSHPPEDQEAVSQIYDDLLGELVKKKTNH